MVEESSDAGIEGTSKTRINVVVISGLFGLAAAAIMYFDAVSRGEEYLQDSLWIIIIAAVLGAVSLIIGIYLYLKPNIN